MKKKKERWSELFPDDMVILANTEETLQLNLELSQRILK